MTYKILKAEIEFDDNGKLKRIITEVSMPGNSKDVRKIEASMSMYWHWGQSFAEWEVVLQKIFQSVTAYGSEIE